MRRISPKIKFAFPSHTELIKKAWSSFGTTVDRLLHLYSCHVPSSKNGLNENEGIFVCEVSAECDAMKQFFVENVLSVISNCVCGSYITL